MEEEKEYYKKEIAKIVDSIDNVELLVYLHRLIYRIVKEGR